MGPDNDSLPTSRGDARLRARARDVDAADNHAARGHQPSATSTLVNSLQATEDLAIVELLLCASDLARNGVTFALAAAVDELGLQYTLTALVAACEARAVGSLYGESMSADAYLEAAYRVVERERVAL